MRHWRLRVKRGTEGHQGSELGVPRSLKRLGAISGFLWFRERKQVGGSSAKHKGRLWFFREQPREIGVGNGWNSSSFASPDGTKGLERTTTWAAQQKMAITSSLDHHDGP